MLVPDAKPLSSKWKATVAVWTTPEVSLDVGPPLAGSPHKGYRHAAGGAQRGQRAVDLGGAGSDPVGIAGGHYRRRSRSRTGNESHVAVMGLWSSITTFAQ